MDLFHPINILFTTITLYTMSEQKKDDKSANAASTGTNTTNGTSQPQQPQQQKDIPSLGALDEDDEFEEFEAQGELPVIQFKYENWLYVCILIICIFIWKDLEDSKTSLAHLNSEGGAKGLNMSGEQGGTGDHLWEDNWDDDDVEDDFGKALR